MLQHAQPSLCSTYNTCIHKSWPGTLARRRRSGERRWRWRRTRRRRRRTRRTRRRRSSSLRLIWQLRDFSPKHFSTLATVSLYAHATRSSLFTVYAWRNLEWIRWNERKWNETERKRPQSRGSRDTRIYEIRKKEREGGREGGREGEREREKGNEKKNFVGSCKGVACWQSSLVNDAARVDSRVPNHHGILTPRWRSSAKSSSETRMKGEWTSEKGGATLGTSGRETGGSTRVEITSILWRWVPPSRFERPFRRVSIFCALSSLSFSSLFRTNRHTLPRSTRDRR